MPRLRRLPSRLLLCAISATLALLCVELGMRLLGLPSREQYWRFLGEAVRHDGTVLPDDSLAWRLRPGALDGEINELGLRGDCAPAPNKTAAEFRVLCIGDSCTFGSGVGMTETYVACLERQLQELRPDRHVHAISAGVPGYSTQQNRVMLDRILPRVAPDYAVLYCGAWNDYVAAVLADDESRSNRSWWAHTRIAEAIDLVHHSRVRDVVYEAFGRGEAPNGRRVPLPNFEANLRTMVATLRKAGARVCLIKPPLPAVTRAKQPIAQRYHDTVTALARELGTDYVDGEALLADRARVLAHVPPAPGTASLCFHDWVHPSVYGHQLIAEALVPLVQATMPAPSEQPRPQITTTEPASLPALTGGKLRIRGSGLAPTTRARLGQWPVAFTAQDADVLLEVPATLPPGRHALVLLGPFGAARASDVELEAPPLTIACTAKSDETTLHVSGTGPPGWRVTAWVAPRTETRSVATAAGPIWLPPSTRIDDPRLPFPFAALPWPHLDGAIGADGRFEIRRKLSATEVANLPEEWAAQALLFDAKALRGLMSAVATAKGR